MKRVNIILVLFFCKITNLRLRAYCVRCLCNFYQCGLLHDVVILT